MNACVRSDIDPTRRLAAGLVTTRHSPAQELAVLRMVEIQDLKPESPNDISLSSLSNSKFFRYIHHINFWTYT
jgi:hypothetical protein